MDLDSPDGHTHHGLSLLMTIKDMNNLTRLILLVNHIHIVLMGMHTKGSHPVSLIGMVVLGYIFM